MSKIFVWLFGVLSGVVATAITVAYCMTEIPDAWADMARVFNRNR